MAHLGQCTHQATSHLSCLDLERAQNVQTNCVCAFAEHPRTSVAQTCDVYETQGPLGTVPLQSTLEPEQCGPQSTCHLRLWQTNCGPSTVSTPHTCQRYQFAVSLPLHRTTKQVSLNKWPPLPPCVRAEIRHQKDLQTEEAKINKEGGTAFNRLKPFK